MIIKEVEQSLGVPRATVRFYEKEGLLSPSRSENGYREYSEEDVVLLKKIIIFRKLGFSVSDIVAVLNRAKPMSEVLECNIENLTRQLQELQGAMMLCRKMQENGEQIETFDAEKYWNLVEEEERAGNRFLEIVKDVAEFEKTNILKSFCQRDENGKLKPSVIKTVSYLIAFAVGILLANCILIWTGHETRAINFISLLKCFAFATLADCVVALPVYLLGRKYPKIAKNQSTIILAVLLTVLVLAVMILAIV
jgi:DNA-binding transcriptional MerR regulator